MSPMEHTENCINATKEQLVVMRAFLDGVKIQVAEAGGDNADCWVDAAAPVWDFVRYRYRVARKIMPSIDWSTVSPKYNYLAIQQPGAGFLYANLPVLRRADGMWSNSHSGAYAIAAPFASYNRGNVDWFDSLIARPGFLEGVSFA